jgi:hypothetical protein
LTIAIEECDFWWFGELYGVVVAFADAPEHTIGRIGGGQIAVPEDQAEDLRHFRECILNKYPSAAGLAIMRLTAEFDEILAGRNPSGPGFERAFWTNEAFQRHPDWQMIRRKSQEFLLR